MILHINTCPAFTIECHHPGLYFIIVAHEHVCLFHEGLLQTEKLRFVMPNLLERLSPTFVKRRCILASLASGNIPIHLTSRLIAPKDAPIMCSLIE